MSKDTQKNVNLDLNQLQNLTEEFSQLLAEIDTLHAMIFSNEEEIDERNEKIEEYKEELERHDYSSIYGGPTQTELQNGDEDYSWGSDDEERDLENATYAEEREIELEDEIENLTDEIKDLKLEKRNSKKTLREALKRLRTQRKKVIDFLITLFTGNHNVNCYTHLPCFDETRGVAFEKLVAILYEIQGYIVEYTKTTGDGGIDLIVTGNSREQIIVQCKQGPSHVGKVADIARSVVGALPNDAKTCHLWLSHLQGISKSVKSYQQTKKKNNIDLCIFGKKEVVDGITNLTDKNLVTLLKTTVNGPPIVPERPVIPLSQSRYDRDPFLEEDNQWQDDINPPEDDDEDEDGNYSDE